MTKKHTLKKFTVLGKLDALKGIYQNPFSANKTKKEFIAYENGYNQGLLESIKQNVVNSN